MQSYASLKELAAIRIERTRAVYRQITDQLQALIRAGHWEEGQRLPTARQLAALWHTDVATVHRAITPLVKQGILERTRRVGTFVRRRAATLTCVGIYYPEEVFGRSLFLQSLQAALKAELDARGLETEVWIDPRPSPQDETPWPAFAQAAEQRRFQVLIVPCTDHPHLGWQTKLPVPAAFQATAHIPNRVEMDRPQMAELGLRALARQGCRSVGLIAPWPTTVRRDPAHNPHQAFFERFNDLSRDLGLRVQNRWMRLLRHEDDKRDRSQEAYGYTEFNQLWRGDDRPEGLVVFPDMVARGVITALLEKQVRVPAELKLVLAKNEGVELLCPVPATLLVSSERAIARALIEQVEKQLRGEPCDPILLPFRAVASRRG